MQFKVFLNIFDKGIKPIMLQIAICDDETLLLDEIKEITEGCMSQQQTFSILSTYTSGKNLFYDIQDGKRHIPKNQLKERLPSHRFIPEKRTLIPRHESSPADDLSPCKEA